MRRAGRPGSNSSRHTMTATLKSTGAPACAARWPTRLPRSWCRWRIATARCAQSSRAHHFRPMCRRVRIVFVISTAPIRCSATDRPIGPCAAFAWAAAASSRSSSPGCRIAFGSQPGRSTATWACGLRRTFSCDRRRRGSRSPMGHRSMLGRRQSSCRKIEL